jgi:hypothetical protein
MASRAPRKHLSVRIPAHLEEFLREQGRKHDGGFSALVEDALTLGAVAHGYQPAATSPAFIAFAETISGMVIERMEEKGLVGKTQGDD